MNNSIVHIIKMDLAICRKSMTIMTVGMLAAGVVCLFFLTPLLLGFFVVGSTAVVSAIFAVESKSNMEFFYGCFPIRKWEYVVGRSITCLLVMTIPSVISVGFIQIGMHGSFCRIEEVRAVTEAFGQYQMLIICAMIMLGFIGGANLLLAAFAGKVESREMLEVLFLLLEGVVAAGILFLIQKTVYHGNAQEFLKAFQNLIANHEGLSCFLFILVGLIALLACTLISLRTIRGKRG